jgi:hypothetical protein
MPPLSKTDFDKLKAYAQANKGREEYIIDKALTVNEIQSALMQFYKKVGKPFVVTLDHTLLVKQSGSEKNTQETLYNLAVMLAEMKNKLPVIFLILTQLNREIDDAERQKPGQLSNYPTEKDVYGSDSLLQCADVMIAYNRPAKYNISYYGPNQYMITPSDKYLLAMHVLKNRYGEVGIQWYRANYAKMLVEETSRIRVFVTAQCHYKIKDVDMPKLEDQKDVEIEKLNVGGLVTRGGLAQVDTGEMYLGANSITILKNMLDAMKEQNKHLMGILNKEGHVYLDSTKVGTALTVGTSRIQ